MNVSKEDQLNYIWISIFIIWFYNTAYLPDISFVVAVVTSIAVIYYLVNMKETTMGNINTDLHYKLESLMMEEEEEDTPDNLHLEPDMINFFYDIRDFRIYNRDSYVKCIINVNTMLGLKKELENDYKYINPKKLSGWQMFGNSIEPEIKTNIKNHAAIFKLARKSANLAINYLHSFVVSLPTGVYQSKHKESVSRFHIYVKRILDEILLVCRENSKDILLGKDYGIPKPSDKELGKFEFFNI